MAIKYALLIKNISDYSEIIAAIITVVGVFVSTIFGFIQFKQSKWNENISKERTKWLKDFREEVGIIMLAYAYFSNNELKHINKKEQNEIVANAEKARYILITRINTNSFDGNEYNLKYKKMLKNIEFTSDINKFDKDEFLKLTNLILENEWQKIKREARGKK